MSFRRDGRNNWKKGHLIKVNPLTFLGKMSRLDRQDRQGKLALFRASRHLHLSSAINLPNIITLPDSTLLVYFSLLSNSPNGFLTPGGNGEERNLEIMLSQGLPPNSEQDNCRKNGVKGRQRAQSNSQQHSACLYSLPGFYLSLPHSVPQESRDLKNPLYKCSDLSYTNSSTSP